MKKLCFVFICCLCTGTSLTHAEVSEFGYRKGLAMSLGISGTRVLHSPIHIDEEFDLPSIFSIFPGLSLTLGYGVNEQRLYYLDTSLSVSDLGMGLGYTHFLMNYEKVYTFGKIGTYILPIPTYAPYQYSESLPLQGVPSVHLRAGIGYQWARYSTIEFALSYLQLFDDEEFDDEEYYRPIAVSIMLRGILW